MSKIYQMFEVPEELQNKALEALELARETGKIKKGANEATKAIERGIASIVLIGTDVTPEEIVMHIPGLADEKEIPFIFINKQADIGAACGLDVGCTAVAIVKVGKSKEIVEDLVNQIKALRG
ncbi:MAG TPA: 50S ribosomal protein L7Ae [Methanocorpusculum sp.]|nr:50S ribosomal protein L7Ae [Methanocorpusculum sp.]HJJ89561.1 50S ribosomal protein L7Ae [Methanocorpusculum sp.]HJJ90867.1 50S ribosomal protein L7Ae [Methanocorpusculum sp.]HJK01655.1 50S ribosomal protein L7Ae [Methanocorpusculum sp.]